MDNACPQLFKALIESHKIDAVFKFFRPNPSGDGGTEQFFTVELKDARITSVKQAVLDTTQSTTSQEPPF